MLDQAIFVTTDLFEASTPKKHFINERCFGEDFGAWLRTRLNEMDIGCGEPAQEDWGWALPVSYSGYKFTISIGVMDESIGQIPAEWRIGLSYERFLNWAAAWFRPAPRNRFFALWGQVRAILQHEPRFKVSDAEQSSTKDTEDPGEHAD